MVKVKKINNKNEEKPVLTPFYKKWWFILLIVICIVSVVRGINDNKSSQTSTKRDSSAQVTKSDKTKKTKVSEETDDQEKTKVVDEPKEDKHTEEVKRTEEKATKVEHKIGEIVKVGDVEYTVNSKSTSQKIGNEFLNKTANGTYLIVNVTVKNTGKKSIRVTSDYFKLLKGDTEYADDGTAGLYSNKDGKFFLSEVNPGNSITGNVVFDLSNDVVNSSGLQLQVQTGAWGTQKGTISLDE